MRFKHLILAASVGLLATAGNPNPAGASPYDTEVPVQSHTVSTTIPWEEALQELPPGAYRAGNPPPIVVAPGHGTLVEGPGEELHYTPDDSFWEIGTDSFVVQVDSLNPDAFVTVTLQASDYRQILNADQTFEGTVEDLSGNANVVTDAAIAGAKGLRTIVANGFSADAVFTFSFDDMLPDGADGNTEEIKVRPPPDDPSGPYGAGSVVIFSLDRLPNVPAADLLLVSGDPNWNISARLYEGASVHTTPLFEIAGAESDLRLDWWNAWEGFDGGLRLWVDGELAGTIFGGSEWDAGEAVRRVGAMLEPMTSSGTMIDIDDVRSSWSEIPRPAFAPTLRDNFEGDLGAWDTTAGAYIETASAAAAVGVEGLEIDAVYGYDGALLDSSPAAETSVGVRMQLSADALSLPANGSLELLALSGLESGSGGDEVRLALQNSFAGLKLVAEARDGGGWSSTPLTTLSAGFHTVELQWQVADLGDDNGALRLWVDGVPGARLGGLDNVGATIESLRLGAWDVSTGTQGALYVDAFESWAFVSSAPQ